jgi:RND family efflux transporter MFP subunit
MKLPAKILALSATFAVSTGLVVYGFMSLPASATTQEPATPAPTQETPAQTEQVTQNVAAAKEVTVMSVENAYNSSIETTGTVSSLTLVNIFAGAPGMVAKVYAQNGQTVKPGDVLFEITGAQGNTHPYVSQLALAQKSYDSAKKSYGLTLNANESSLKAAELQLQSAQHQAEGAKLDLQGMDVNLNGIKNGELILRDTFDHSRVKNGLDYNNTEDAVNGLSDAIDTLEQQKYNAEQDLEDLGTIETPEEQAMYDQLKTGIDTMNTTLEDLYSKVDSANYGYSTLQEGLIMGENQMLGQLAQTKTQGEALYLTRQSTAAKLGLSGDSETTDGVLMAQEAVNATKLRNEASVVQVKSGVDASAINLQMAQAQADGLKVKATIGGTLEGFDVHAGQMVGQQTPVANILDTSAFELKSFVDTETAQRIDGQKPAQVKIGGRWVPVKIIFIGNTADPMTKLVPVTLQLPKIALKANQILNVQLPLLYSSTNVDVKTVFIPLDALIVGTEESYVYVNDNGTARKRAVKTGTISGDRVEIIEGLSGSDAVIVKGARDLTDGDLVTVL